MKTLLTLLLLTFSSFSFAKVKIVKNKKGISTSNFTFIKSHSGRQWVSPPKAEQTLYGYDLTLLKQWKNRYADPERKQSGSLSKALFFRMVSPAMSPRNFLKLECANSDCSKKIRYEIFEARASFVINKPVQAFTAQKVMNSKVLKKLTPEATHLFCNKNNKHTSELIQTRYTQLSSMSDSQISTACKNTKTQTVIADLPQTVRNDFCEYGLEGIQLYRFTNCQNSDRYKTIRTRVNFSKVTKNILPFAKGAPFLESQSDIRFISRSEVQSPKMQDFLSYIKIHPAPVTAMMTQTVHNINFLSKFGNVIILFQELEHKKTLVSVFFVLAVKKHYLDMNLQKIFKISKSLPFSGASGRSFIMGESFLNTFFRGIGGSRLETAGLPGFGKDIVQATAQALKQM